MKPLAMVVMVTALVLAAAGAAYAEVTVESLGQASGYDREPEAATRRAMDDAGRQAVDQVVGTVIDPETRKANTAVIKAKILRRAKAYIVSSKVLDQGLVESVWQVHLEVVVSDDQLKIDLGKLKIPLAGASAVPVATPPQLKPRVTIIVVGEGSVSQLAGRLEKSVKARGIDVASVVTFETPRDDAQVLAEATKAAAPRAFVVSATMTAPGRIRGTPLYAADVGVSVRMIAPGTGAGPAAERSGDANTHVGAPGIDAPRAEAAALAEAAVWAERRLVPLMGNLGTSSIGTPTPGRAKGVLVHVIGASRWQEPKDMLAALAAVPGVTQVTIVEVERGTVTVRVVGSASANTLAKSLATGNVRVRGNDIDVVLTVPRTTPVPDAESH